VYLDNLQIALIPEPRTLPLILAGLATLITRRMRR
jgi:hypothetical protein